MSNALSKKPYKGTRDFFPAQKRTQDFIFAKMKEAAELFGYEPYNGPLLEEVDLYKAKSGEELINEQIYSFTDRGERHVAIRPEMTPTLARMVAQIHREEAKPLRWYAIPNLMRYENPQKGRLREHWQFNCDIFGAPEALGELEILQVIIHLLQSFGASDEHFEILINGRQIVERVFKGLIQADAETTHKLYKILDRAKKIPAVALQELVDKLGLSTSARSVFNSYCQIGSFEQLFSFLEQNKIAEVGDSMKKLVSKMQAIGLGKFITYDPTIVRGLDYYTGIVFEVYDKNPENRRAICGGGAYGNLLEIFNEPALTGIGFGLGDVTLHDFLVTHKLVPDFSRAELDIFLTFQTEEAEELALAFAQKFRQEKLKVALHLSPLKLNKVFPLAEKKGARFVGMLGTEELAGKKVTLKNLTSHEQVSFTLQDQLDMNF